MRSIAIVLPLCLLAAAAAAQAQSQVTVYGRLDPTIGRQIGSTNWIMRNGTGSRFGLNGTEDLGGGLSAFFKLEHRLDVDTGGQTNAQHFWQHSLVGLAGPFGRIWFGRDFTPAYIDTMVAADPFGNATAASFTTIVTGGISPVRSDDMVSYKFAAGSFAVTGAVSIDKNTPPLAGYPHRPVSLSAGYTGGPLKLTYGYENPGAIRDEWHTLLAAYSWGGTTLRGFIGKGRHTSGNDRETGFVSLVLPVTGQSQVLLAYGRLKDEAAGTMQSRIGAGYYHSLSKRTTLYVDLAQDSKATTQKTGYDVGLRHAF